MRSSYGAVDEEGEGDWTFDGKAVRLTSNPMPKAPSFELVRDDPRPQGRPLHDARRIPVSNGATRLEAIVADGGRANGASKFRPTIPAGVDLTGKPSIVALAPEMPVYGPTGDIFPLSADRGHRLLFRFRANDLGKARFDKEPLKKDGDDLLMERYDTSFRFVKVRP